MEVFEVQPVSIFPRYFINFKISFHGTRACKSPKFSKEIEKTDVDEVKKWFPSEMFCAGFSMAEW